jgi:hypothetical protein
MNNMEKLKRRLFSNQLITGVLVICLILLIIIVVYRSQAIAEENAFQLDPSINMTRDQYELAKVAAEIRQIRSDTTGSLFWLKLIALFVTVGGAVGGYLIGQNRITRNRLNFEHRKDVDNAYQEIIKELSSKEAVLRAAAAVKLGSILQAFPVEWKVDKSRKNELVQLSKQVLAAALAIEENVKVLKTISISIVLHKPWKEDVKNNQKQYADLRGIDLSSASAKDAYWAKTDFTYADFYRADLAKASFRNSILTGAQFRNAALEDSVFIGANCEGANFKLADLRRASFNNANLRQANFEGARIHGINLTGAVISIEDNITVDVSQGGDGSGIRNFKEWLTSNYPDVQITK